MDTLNTPVRVAEEFRVVTGVSDAEAVVRLVGELDCATAPILRDSVDDLRAQGVSRVVMDMAQLTFIDSSGLRELVVALTRQREVGGEVVLQGPSPQTMRVLDMVGLSRVFTIL
ncbi:MAG: STAS domain-containing protein [Actinomycetota bacterium]|nr:STAS domain-containing protein [Actinomycetota bacterium]